MASLQKKLDCSESKLIMVAREFRRQGVEFEPHIREDLLALSHSLDEFFTVEKISDFVTQIMLKILMWQVFFVFQCSIDHQY